MFNKKPIYKGKKVNFDGLEFDSKTEATWYRFFKLLGWHVEYNPDFPGRGYYIPDFLIIGKTRKILVEIKPLFEGDFTTSNQYYNAAITGYNAIDWEQANQAGIRDFLIFGAKFDVMQHNGAFAVDGIAAGRMPDDIVGWTSVYIPDENGSFYITKDNIKIKEGLQYDLADQYNDYSGKVYDTSYKIHQPVEIYSQEYDRLNYLWNQAVTDLKYNHAQ